MLFHTWVVVIVLQASSPDEVVSVQINGSFSFWVVPRNEVYLGYIAQSGLLGHGK